VREPDASAKKGRKPNLLLFSRPRSVGHLCDSLNTLAASTEELVRLRYDAIDFGSLPTFAEFDGDTAGLFSWDECDFLVPSTGARAPWSVDRRYDSALSAKSLVALSAYLTPEALRRDGTVGDAHDEIPCWGGATHGLRLGRDGRVLADGSWLVSWDVRDSDSTSHRFLWLQYCAGVTPMHPRRARLRVFTRVELSR